MKISEVTQPVQEGINDPHIFKAVFMAGAPGAGKSTISKMLFGSSGLKPLNVDNFWILYNKTGRTGDYDKFWKHYQSQEKSLVSGRIGLIIDGTAKNPKVIEEIKTRLEAHGYETIMVFVDVSLETSLKRAESRAADQTSPDFGRTIDTDFIKTTYKRIQDGADQLRSLFGQNFFTINNEADAPDTANVERKIRRWLNTPVRNEIARNWIENQKSAVRSRVQPRGQTPARPANTPPEQQPADQQKART